MPRISRAVAVGFPHHITQRGNYRQSVFERKDDYLFYLEWLKTYSSKYSLKIWAYCLMKNHVHFIAVPMESDSMARTFNTLHMRYSQFMNQRRNARGHLWQGRFFSSVLDERHLYAGMRYVENNPVRARIVKKADEYRWSSAGSHVHGTMDPVLSNDCHMLESISNWSAYLREKEDQHLIDAIHLNTRTGRPCGDSRLILRLDLSACGHAQAGKMLGRRLQAMPRGRPRKRKQ